MEHECDELPEDTRPAAPDRRDVTWVVSAIGVDPEGVGWVRPSVQTPDDVEIIEPEEWWFAGRVPANMRA